MQVSGGGVQILAVFHAKEIGHYGRIEHTAVPPWCRPSTGISGNSGRKFFRGHRLQPLIAIFFRPRNAERSVQPHAEGLIAHAKRNRGGHETVRLVHRQEQWRGAILAARQRWRTDDLSAILQMRHMAAGTV